MFLYVDYNGGENVEYAIFNMNLLNTYFVFNRIPLEF